MKALFGFLLSAVLIGIGRAQDCLSSPCDVNACCVSVDGSSVCECHAGFEGDGFSCTDINECDDNPCSEGASCLNANGSFVCICDAGFTGDGLTCDDVDECADNTTCGEHAVCENGDGNFTCTCDEGFEGDAYCGCTVSNPCLANDTAGVDLCGENNFEICVASEDDPAGYTCEACDSREKADDAHLECQKPGRGQRRGFKSKKSKKSKKARRPRGK